MPPPEKDSVGNIHKRWSFTRINPSSHKFSFIISMVAGFVVIFLSHIFIIKSQSEEVIMHGTLGLLALSMTKLTDYAALGSSPLNKMSKVMHVSAFSMFLWAATVAVGIASSFIFAKETISSSFIVEGMFFAIGLRIGIFVSVFGAGHFKAVSVSVIEPLIFLAVIIPLSAFMQLFELTGIIFGLVLLLTSIIWTIIVDRAGRPAISSTFRLLQAFLAAWTEKKTDSMEEYAESRSKEGLVKTVLLKFSNTASADPATYIIIPEVHPGPFAPIGGSDLPYYLYKTFSKRALVMHSISDHSLNIPSKSEMEKYLKSLSNILVEESGKTCSVPLQIKINNATSTGIAFGSTAVILLSLAPKGMEDIPKEVQMEIQEYSEKIGFKNSIIIDTHNAMGETISREDMTSIIESAKSCLRSIKDIEQSHFKIAFSSINNLTNTPPIQDLGKSGIAVTIFEINGKLFALGWADSNNMQKGLREMIISKVSDDSLNFMEICTSDTHATSGKRNRSGYYALGDITDKEYFFDLYLEAIKQAKLELKESCYELIASSTKLKVMGKNQFDDYSIALDRSMNMTKVFVGLTIFTLALMFIIT